MERVCVTRAVALALFFWACAHALPAADGAADGRDWPCWRGPFGNGSAGPCGSELVDDLTAAKLIWKSAEPIPDTYVSDSRHVVPRAEARFAGGYASPVIVGARVYVYYYWPSGEVYDEAATRRHVEGGGIGREKWFIDVDDVLVCMDAATGKTVWRTAFKQGGINLNSGFNKGGGLLTPCVGMGRVYALGTAGRVYAVDAATGEPLWQNDIGERAAAMERLRERCHRERRLPGFRSDMGSCPAYADGVVCCDDHILYKSGQRAVGNGVVAFDAATGLRLWAVPDCLGWCGSPVRWVHKGREYFIAVGDSRGVCIEPRSGKVLWAAQGMLHDNAPAVTEDYLVCNGSRGEKGGGGLSCFRISLAGATKAWSLPAELAGTDSCPAIYNGHVYAQAGKELLCVELETGKLKGRLASNSMPASMVVGDGRLFQHDSKKSGNVMLMYRADGPAFKLLGKPPKIPVANSTTPSLAGGRLYVRGTDAIYCYELKKGTP